MCYITSWVGSPCIFSQHRLYVKVELMQEQLIQMIFKCLLNFSCITNNRIWIGDKLNINTYSKESCRWHNLHGWMINKSNVKSTLPLDPCCLCNFSLENNNPALSPCINMLLCNDHIHHIGLTVSTYRMKDSPKVLLWDSDLKLVTFGDF